MNTEMLVNLLRSPAGLPSHPVIFLILLVLTWTLHIIAVHIMLGSITLSLLGSFLKHPNWQLLSNTMLSTAKVAVSIAIVLGVAPLLFVQTIYDPFWYTANVLSARWVIAFVGILLIAYYSLYHRYFKKHESEHNNDSWPSLVVSLALFLLAGFIMHSLSTQMLRPDQWSEWFSPGGHIDASGSKLHEYNLWRFIYFISLSVPVIGAWLFGLKTYLKQRETVDFIYLEWMENLARKLMSVGSALSVVFYLLWLSTLPEIASDFAISTGSILGLLATITLGVTPVILNEEKIGYGAMMTASVAVLFIAIAREWLRMHILIGEFNYQLFSYPINFDSYSTLLFFLTLVFIGCPAIAYAIFLSWHSGLSSSVYMATPAIDKFGRITLISLSVWIAQYFLFGLITLIV